MPRARSPVPRGFTLLELLVTLAVAGVLLALAAPSLQALLTGRAVDAQSQEFVAALRFARSEAIKRGGPVTVCRTDAPGAQACSTAATGTWQYWLVFAENSAAGNTLGQLDPGETPLRVQSASAGPAVFDALATHYVSFQSTGIVLSDASPGIGQGQLVWWVRPNSGTGTLTFSRNSRQVCLNQQGRAAITDGSGSCST